MFELSIQVNELKERKERKSKRLIAKRFFLFYSLKMYYLSTSMSFAECFPIRIHLMIIFQ